MRKNDITTVLATVNSRYIYTKVLKEASGLAKVSLTKKAIKSQKKLFQNLKYRAIGVLLRSFALICTLNEFI